MRPNCRCSIGTSCIPHDERAASTLRDRPSAARCSLARHRCVGLLAGARNARDGRCRATVAAHRTGEGDVRKSRGVTRTAAVLDRRFDTTSKGPEEASAHHRERSTVGVPGLWPDCLRRLRRWRSGSVSHESSRAPQRTVAGRGLVNGATRARAAVGRRARVVAHRASSGPFRLRWRSTRWRGCRSTSWPLAHRSMVSASARQCVWLEPRSGCEGGGQFAESFNGERLTDRPAPGRQLMNGHKHTLSRISNSCVRPTIGLHEDSIRAAPGQQPDDQTPPARQPRRTSGRAPSCARLATGSDRSREP
jgi:hypothetical protein